MEALSPRLRKSVKIFRIFRTLLDPTGTGEFGVKQSCEAYFSGNFFTYPFPFQGFNFVPLQMFLDNWRQNILMNEELELLRYLFESVDSLRNLYIGSLTLKTVSDAHLENSATINIINAFFSSVHCIQDFVIADEFLAKTASYYEAFFSRLLRSEEDPQKSIVREYIVVANKILDFERHAVATVYIGIVPRQLERTLIDTIVSPNLPLLFREFPSLLKEFNTDLILAAYTLIATEGERAVEIVRRNYEDHVVTCCEKYVKKMCDHSTLISDTLRYVNAMTKECSLIFPNDKHFSSSVSKVTNTWTTTVTVWRYRTLLFVGLESGHRLHSKHCSSLFIIYQRLYAYAGFFERRIPN